MLKRKAVLEHDSQGKCISHIQFGMFGPAEVAKLAEFEVVNDRGYEQPARTPVHGGVLDRRLGISDKQSTCETCGARLQDCPGHFGYIKLELPVFHIGYIKALVAVLQCICKTCSRVLLPPTERQRMLRQLRHPMLASDYVRRGLVSKKIIEKCKKVRECPHCGALNGVVKKVGATRLVHEVFREKDSSELSSSLRREFVASFEAATAAPKGTFENNQTSGADLKALIARAHDDLNPLRVRALLHAIPRSELALLDMSDEHGRPITLLIEHLLVPPVPIRPSVMTESSMGSNEARSRADLGPISALSRADLGRDLSCDLGPISARSVSG